MNSVTFSGDDAEDITFGPLKAVETFAKLSRLTN
jgi:hypothetical protein